MPPSLGPQRLCPPAPQTWPEGQGLQLGVVPPHPSLCGPHVPEGKLAHVFSVLHVVPAPEEDPVLLPEEDPVLLPEEDAAPLPEEDPVLVPEEAPVSPP